MGSAAQPETGGWNYFNYFTEVEQHFQQARGTGLFLLSPLDWALLETWRKADIPLEAVLRGIDTAFEKWRTRKRRIQQVNSLAYCAQAVFREAEILSGAAPPKVPATSAPFTLDELREHLQSNAHRLSIKAGFEEISAALTRLAASADEHYQHLEELEQRLTALEDKMCAIAKGAQSEEDLFKLRKELDLQLRPYRSKMTADQLSMLERQFSERKFMDLAGLPRLSLFFLH